MTECFFFFNFWYFVQSGTLFPGFLDPFGRFFRSRFLKKKVFENFYRYSLFSRDSVQNIKNWKKQYCHFKVWYVWYRGNPSSHMNCHVGFRGEVQHPTTCGEMSHNLFGNLGRFYERSSSMNHFVCKWVTKWLTNTFFWKPYILQRIHFTDMLIKYKILKIENNNILF